jgi:DNA-binding transcriptional ArsR family regulator
MKSNLKDLAQGYGLLSDETRLKILQALVKGPINVTRLCKAIGKRQPVMSHHLGLLRMGRLVEGTRHGKEVIYSIEKDAMKALSAGVADIMRK